MANNRLYIVDTGNGDKFLLSKGLCFGWGGIDRDNLERFDKWLEDRDVLASSGDGPTKLKLITENEMPPGWATGAFDGYDEHGKEVNHG